MSCPQLIAPRAWVLLVRARIYSGIMAEVVLEQDNLAVGLNYRVQR